MDSDKAFRYCKKTAKSHYENFPVGLFVPKEIRKYVYVIYTFARTADDIADDDNLQKQQKLTSLNEFEDKLNDCYNDKYSDPLFFALNITIRKFDIPLELFRSLLFAFKMDVEKNRFNTFNDLIYYSKHSANPIGRLILLLSGIRNGRECRLSDSICTALQLTNFWQDIIPDLKMNRIYIPLEDMKNNNYSEDNLFAKKTTANFKNILSLNISKTEEMFFEGSELIGFLKGRLKFEIILTILGGSKILQKIKKCDYDVLSFRPKITFSDKITLLLKTVFIWLFQTKIY